MRRRLKARIKTELIMQQESSFSRSSSIAREWYHINHARTLDELGRRDLAEEHWQAFAAQAPDSPWADEARSRLGN